MIDCETVTRLFEGSDADPRLDPNTVRCLSSEGVGTVVLVGVVHDHPASVARVNRVLAALTPSYLAVELPPLAMALFRMYADDDQIPPRLGGEMSAALQAAPGIESVGIDGPNWQYLRQLLRGVKGEDVPWDVLRTVLRDVLSGLAHALACRIVAPLGRLTPIKLRVYSHLTYEISLLDSPKRQADDEASHVAQRQAFLHAVEVPQAIQLIDTAREDSMAGRIRDLRASGDVVAIVGMEHLDPLVARLRERPT